MIYVEYVEDVKDEITQGTDYFCVMYRVEL